ncbi:MAG: hypothetical protein IJZ93_02250 [Clostridia bacterium]|nr:hypothetical protein [Clostridia bacterium]
MTKRFLKISTLAMGVTTLLAIFFAYLYAILGAKIADGDGALMVLSVLETAFDFIQISVGFATVIYAFSKYEFNEALKIFGIFSAAIFVYCFTCMIPITLMSDGTALYDFSVVYEGSILNIFYCIGQVFVCQIIPAVAMIAIICKLTKNSKPTPKKFISWKNPVQKGMIISCLVLAAFNFVIGILTDYGIFGYLLQEGFRTTSADAKIILTNFLSLTLSVIAANIIAMYIVFMIVYKVYDALIARDENLKAKAK